MYISQNLSHVPAVVLSIEVVFGPHIEHFATHIAYTEPHTGHSHPVDMPHLSISLGGGSGAAVLGGFVGFSGKCTVLFGNVIIAPIYVFHSYE